MKQFIIILIIFTFFISGCTEISFPESTKCGSMTLEEAKEIALNSNCTEDGSLKPTYNCNEGTNTWWLDIDIEMEGCNPACVINTETKESEINGRCTGLILEDLQEECENDGGEWKTFSNGCADSCILVREEGMIYCTEALTDGCDCGLERCWNDDTKMCEPNNSHMKVLD